MTHVPCIGRDRSVLVTSSTYFGALRIKKVVGSTTTRYLCSGSKPVAEYVGSTNPTLSKEYIYAGSTLLATIAGDSTTYHHPDQLSIRAETDADGLVVRSYGHLPYGELWYESAFDQLRFTTYTRDSGTGESGLDYAIFRQYNSGQGRFMSPDLLPGGLLVPQSLNRDSYANNDPLNLRDPLGLEPLTCAPGMTRIYNGHGPGYCVLDPEPQPTSYDLEPPDKEGFDCRGKTIKFGPNTLVSSDANGAVNAVGIRLTGNDPVTKSSRGGPLLSVPANTWVGAKLESNGSLSIGFSNPIYVKPGGSGSLTGAYISSATFSKGSFTEVKGSAAVLGLHGSTATTSDKIKDGLNDNPTAVQVAEVLQTVLAIFNLLLNCNDL
jgi:RHS repeat-associated protein